MGRVARCLVSLRHAVSASLGAVAIGAAAPAGAEAVTTCTYDSAADVLIVSMSADNDSALVQLGVGNVIDVRQSSGVVSCSGGTPTTENTDAINVTDASGSGGSGATRLTVFDPSAFASLAINDQPGGGNDTFVLFGDNVPGQFVAGTSGVNTDGDAAKEINFVGLPENIQMFGNSAADTFSARGGGTTGAVLNGPFVQLRGGDGADTLQGSEVGDLLEGGRRRRIDW